MPIELHGALCKEFVFTVRSQDETWHEYHFSAIRDYNDIYAAMLQSHCELNYVGSARGDPNQICTSHAVSGLFYLPQTSRSVLQFGIPEA